VRQYFVNSFYTYLHVVAFCIFALDVYEATVHLAARLCFRLVTAWLKVYV